MVKSGIQERFTGYCVILCTWERRPCIALEKGKGKLLHGQKRTGREELLNTHDVAALVYKADFLVWEKVKEMVTHPSLVRERIDQLRSQHTTVLGKEEIEASIASLHRQMSNLFKLAQNATD